MRNEKYEMLPVEVQAKVKEILKAYDEVYVIYEYGEYHVSASICLKAVYASDHKFIGEYKAKDVFTSEERILNYVESFHSYPIQYKGERDYMWLNSLPWETELTFDAKGNIVAK